MKLDTEFIQLPWRFDAGRLAAEVAALPEEAWRPHPQGHPGNSALPLVAAGGDPANDATKGPMRPTPHLARLPCLRQALAAFGTVLGRTRLMRLDGDAEATLHTDTNYYWFERVRIHLPLVTDPAVRFLCGARELHMAAGEVWIFDTWQTHNVVSPNPTRRIHLVADSVGSASFWAAVARGRRPFAADGPAAFEPRFVPFDPAAEPELAFETVNQPVVMSPWEQGEVLRFVRRELAAGDNPRPLAGELTVLLAEFARAWRALWAAHGAAPDGWPAFRERLDRLAAGLVRFEGQLRLASGSEAVEIVRQLAIRPALNPELAPPAVAPVAGPAGQAGDDPGAFRTVYSPGFAGILEGLGVSLLVSTYQSGRLIAVRADGQGGLNTHLRAFPSPMGIAVTPAGFILGTERHVWELANQPEVGKKLQPHGKHDACYLLRKVHVTGDIRVHELAVGQDGLLMINTRFSCLAGLDADNSFVPRWRPPFVTALSPDDRCHLNGLAMIDGRPRFVTALGATDTPLGWREGRADGGVLVDVPSGEILLSGLSVPHSPRWYGGRLWVLESGKGEVGVADLDHGRVECLARLPGFTRGLAFAGRYAFVGLSQVRESNLFVGLPLAERADELRCGVWVLDLGSGTLAAFLRFEGLVQEIFDLQILPARYPEIVEPDSDLLADAFTLPAAPLAEVAPG
ncbi:MAG TPA: TIGR03032 family protein [Thermoanaerobaculia bacterium]|jgi:uncharacterized protein (TIGR03032 family)|nr:TIGR03032 family protein [Thermoanaerobaculia bacterium]